MDAQIQRALAHPKRREVLGYLVQKGDGSGVSEGELAAAFGMGIRMVEYHLKVLRDASLIAYIDDGQKPGDTGRLYVAVPAADYLV